MLPFPSRTLSAAFGTGNHVVLNATVTVTVTEEFVVRPLQLVRWRITQSNCRV